SKKLYVTRRHQKPLRQATYNADKRYLVNHWKGLHSIPVRSIKLAHVASALNDIKRDHGLTSAERAREALSGFFPWAIRQGLTEVNPVIATEHPFPSGNARTRVLSPDEIRAILGACREDDFGRIVKLLFFTGCRIGEIGGLQGNGIDVRNETNTNPGSRA